MKYCSQCGKQNSDDAKFCIYCGTKFRDLSDRVSNEESVDVTSESQEQMRESEDVTSLSESHTASTSPVILKESLSESEATSESYTERQSISQSEGLTSLSITNKETSDMTWDEEKPHTMRLSANVLNILALVYTGLLTCIGVIGYYLMHNSSATSSLTSLSQQTLSMMQHIPALYEVVWVISIIFSIIAIIRFYKHQKEKVNLIYIGVGVVNTLLLWYVSPLISFMKLAISAYSSASSGYAAMFGMMNSSNMALAMSVMSRSASYLRAIEFVGIISVVALVVSILIALQLHKVYQFTPFFNTED